MEAKERSTDTVFGKPYPVPAAYANCDALNTVVSPSVDGILKASSRTSGSCESIHVVDDMRTFKPGPNSEWESFDVTPPPGAILNADEDRQHSPVDEENIEQDELFSVPGKERERTNVFEMATIDETGSGFENSLCETEGYDLEEFGEDDMAFVDVESDKSDQSCFTF